MLFHLRKLAREGITNAVAGKLSFSELQTLKKVLKQVKLRGEEEDSPSLKKASTALNKARGQEQGNEQQLVPFESPNSRTLKPTTTDISMDSEGLPVMFQESATSGQHSQPSKPQKAPKHF